MKCTNNIFHFTIVEYFSLEKRQRDKRQTYINDFLIFYEMGNIQSISKKNFEQIQIVCKDNNTDILLISTLDVEHQHCLIKNTLSINDEIKTINECISKNKKKHIVIYGKSHYDNAVYSKYKQLKDLGFINIHLYLGGMFEWLCLQEIYGKELFPTIGYESDLLKYK